MVDRSKFKPTSQLYFHKELFNDEISYFQQYVIEVSGQFEEKVRQLNHNYQPAEELEDAFFEAFKAQELEFPRILNSSVFISIQTILEKTLKKLFKSCERVYGLRARKKRRGESEIGYYKNLFETLLDFDFTEVATAWNKIDEYRKIRNVFVHHGGGLRSVAIADKETVLNIIEADNRLLYNKHTDEIIIFDNQYLICYLHQVQIFCNALYDLLILKQKIS